MRNCYETSHSPSFVPDRRRRYVPAPSMSVWLSGSAVAQKPHSAEKWPMTQTLRLQPGQRLTASDWNRLRSPLLDGSWAKNSPSRKMIGFNMSTFLV